MSFFDETGILNELNFRTSRSSGPGGQSVNKLNTKVELMFNVQDSKVLFPHQIETLLEKLSNRINANGMLSLSSDETRSQLKNKVLVINRFLSLLNEALTPIKKRKPMRRSTASIEKRLRNKKYKSEKKKNRNNIIE